MLIKTLGILITFICSSFVLALEVRELNQGSCHVSFDNKSDLKVASFNDGKAFTLLYGQWQRFVEGLESEYTETFIHCSGQGARVVLNIETQKGRECVWADVNNGSLRILDRDLSQFNEGICDGVLENRLILSFQKNGLSEEDNLIQLESSLGVEISDYRILAKGIIEVEFLIEQTEMTIFDMRKLLLKKKSLRLADLVTRQRPIGDYIKLEEFSN